LGVVALPLAALLLAAYHFNGHVAAPHLEWQLQLHAWLALLAYAALFQIADAVQVMALGLLRGVQDTRVPMWLAALSYWVIGIPASYVLAFTLGMGGTGLWLGLVIGLTVAATLLMVRFWSRAPEAPLPA